jgi:acetylornithine deacetylase/succinyl-diaminopimelate desuccinylase-like protein
MKMTREQIDLWFENHRAEIMADYYTLLRYPTIGADPARVGDCVDCAMWIKAFLEKLGFIAELVQQTPALPPLVIAERMVPDAERTLLSLILFEVRARMPSCVTAN